MTFRTLNYGNYGAFLTMGNVGFISSTVVPNIPTRRLLQGGLHESSLGAGGSEGRRGHPRNLGQTRAKPGGRKGTGSSAPEPQTFSTGWKNEP